MAKELYTIEVRTRHGAPDCLRMHFTTKEKRWDAVHKLRMNGYRVSSAYDPALTLNPTKWEALETAKALLPLKGNRKA